MNTKHQLGVEAARSGQRRDERMSAEWLEGFDAENDISPGEKVFRGAERAAVVAWLRDCPASEWNALFTGKAMPVAWLIADAIERGDHMGAK